MVTVELEKQNSSLAKQLEESKTELLNKSHDMEQLREESVHLRRELVKLKEHGEALAAEEHSKRMTEQKAEHMARQLL